jgi:hypothetical protein
MTSDLFAPAPPSLGRHVPAWLDAALAVALDSRRKTLAAVRADPDLHARVMQAIAVAVDLRSEAYRRACTDAGHIPFALGLGWIAREPEHVTEAMELLRRHHVELANLPVPEGAMDLSPATP